MNLPFVNLPFANPGNKLFKLSFAATLLASASAPTVFAQDNGEVIRELEEIIVTARKKQESLQDVPVAVTAVSGEAIEAYGLDKLSTIAERIPNFKIQTGGAGAGGGIFFRGIGASANGGAFESSLAVSVDGGIVNTARITQNSFFDIESFEVLKGPQALYFGKAATAGVLSLRTNNPTDEFEASGSISYETERETTIAEGVVSGPITDSFGARLAVRYKDTAVLNENLALNVANPERGEDSLDARLTLDWQPTDSLNFNMKYTNMNYEGDGTLQNTRVQQLDTLVPGLDKNVTPVNLGTLAQQGGFTIVEPGQTALPDAPQVANSAGSKYLRDGVPYTENETQLFNLTSTFDINENYRVTGVFSWIDIEDEGLDNYSQAYDASGTSGSLNTFDIKTFEARLEGDPSDRVSFMLGAFIEDSNQGFEADQFTGFGAIGGAVPLFYDDVAPIIATTPGFEGATHDISKIHDTDSEITAVFASVDIDITDKLSLSGGARFTDVEREGTIAIPFVTDYLSNFGDDPRNALTLLHIFGQIPPTLPRDLATLEAVIAATPSLQGAIAGTQALFAGAANTSADGTFTTPVIEYEEDDVDFEVTLNYEIVDGQSVYVAYKEAFKPGGIDNAATAWNDDITSLTSAGEGLVFGAEEVDGFEIGYKGTLLDNTLRLNGVFYNYDYTDFQVQAFDSGSFSFVINNAGAVKSQGIEIDFEYLASIDGLSFYGSLAWDNSEFEDFDVPIVNHTLEGRRPASLAEFAGNLGANYERPLGDTGWNYNLGYNLNFSSDYYSHNQLSGICADDSPGCAKEGLPAVKQGGYATHDLLVRFTSPDETWNASIIANNVTDKFYMLTSGGTVPGAVDDHSLIYNYGRTVTFRLGVSF